MEQRDYDEMWEHVFTYIHVTGPCHRHVFRLCRKFLLSLDYESVLDVGCGPGHNIPLLCSSKAVKYLGVDISQKILDVARQKYNSSDFQYLDIEKGHLNGQWDLVFCSLVLEHVIDDEIALENMYKMTAKYLLLVTIQGDLEKYAKNERLQGHVRNYRRGELAEKLERKGFEIIDKFEWGFPFYSPVGRMIYDLNPNKVTGSFGFIKRSIAFLFYLLYFLNSSHRGDIIVVLAEVQSRA